MNPLDIAFFGYLVYRNRELLPVFREHLQDQYGQVLPYMLLADMVRWMQMEMSESTNELLVRRIMAELESTFEDEVDLRELLVGGFLENLPDPGEKGAELLNLLGPRMRAHHSMMRKS